AADSKVPIGLGIPALFLGALALLLSLTPYVRSAQSIFGIISLPLGGLGLLLGIGGLAIAILQKGQGIGFPIAGSASSLVALAMAVVWLSWLRPERPAVPHASSPANVTSVAETPHQ